jgi:hypothetical protein
VSNNVGIDFAELGPPHGSKPSNTTQTTQKEHGQEKQEDLKTIGFRVKPKAEAIILDHANRIHTQYLLDHHGPSLSRGKTNTCVQLAS